MPFNRCGGIHESPSTGCHTLGGSAEAVNVNETGLDPDKRRCPVWLNYSKTLGVIEVGHLEIDINVICSWHAVNNFILP